MLPFQVTRITSPFTRDGPQETAVLVKTNERLLHNAKCKWALIDQRFSTKYARELSCRAYRKNKRDLLSLFPRHGRMIESFGSKYWWVTNTVSFQRPDRRTEPIKFSPQIIPLCSQQEITIRASALEPVPVRVGFPRQNHMLLDLNHEIVIKIGNC